MSAVPSNSEERALGPIDVAESQSLADASDVPHVSAPLADAGPIHPCSSRSIEALFVRWRLRADSLASWGASDTAKAFRAAAYELEAVMLAESSSTVNLTEASVETGYSADHLGRLVREGRIPNAGRKSAPRIRRQDLPRKVQTTRDARIEPPDSTTLSLTRRALSRRR